MAGRSYDQFCSLAKALDVLGERWTLLVVRELLQGPRRYSDLLENLPGIGTNLLASRLKALEANGLVVRRRLPPPAASNVYDLTARGRALKPAIIELSRWGLDLLAEPGENDAFRAGWLVFALQSAFRPEMARGVRRSYRLTVGDLPHTIRVEDGTIDVQQTDAGEVDVEIVVDEATLKDIAAGKLAAADAVASGRVEIPKGDPAEAIAFADLLDGPKALAQAAPAGA